MTNQATIVGLLAAAVGAYFLLRPKTATAAIAPPGEWYAPLLLPPEPYGPPLPPGYTSSTYTDPLERLTMPKGIRNHNPMNLRWFAPINWVGQIGPDVDGYAKFSEVHFGIRAGVKNLVNGYFNKGIDSPVNIIEKYAPSHENPTDAYIRFIAERMGVDKTTSIPLTRDNMIRLTKAIIHFENGSQPYADATIERGVDAGMA